MSMLKRSLFLSPFLVGCYSYAPIDPAAAPVGTEVRAHISGAASDRIAPIIQQFNQRVLTGKIDENNAGAMTLEIQTGAMLNTGSTVAPLMQRVPLDRGEVVQLESRQISPSRTAMLMGVVVAGAGLAAWAALHGGGDSSGDNGGTGGPPPINRIPIIRFHF